MSDRRPEAGAAERAIAYLQEVSPELRGCAVLDSSGAILASTGEGGDWAEASRRFMAAADSAGGGAASQVHVATGDGECFAVREGELVAVAVTERFVLSSLTLFDMRVALRDAAAARA